MWIDKERFTEIERQGVNIDFVYDKLRQQFMGLYLYDGDAYIIKKSCGKVKYIVKVAEADKGE